MNKQLTDRLAAELGISPDQVVREEYELIILKSVFESELGKGLVFKGGTALRLAYGSPRFSEDLDFSVVNKLDRQKLTQLLTKIADQNEALELKQALQKKNTYLGLFKVREVFLSQALTIKFEVSVRPIKLEKEKDYQLLNLNSQVTSLTVLAQVASLEWIRKEKQTIKPPRVRDIYDLWFLAQKLGEPAKMDFQGWKPSLVRRELHKFLPFKNRRLLNQWLPEN